MKKWNFSASKTIKKTEHKQQHLLNWNILYRFNSLKIHTVKNLTL